MALAMIKKEFQAYFTLHGHIIILIQVLQNSVIKKNAIIFYTSRAYYNSNSNSSKFNYNFFFFLSKMLFNMVKLSFISFYYSAKKISECSLRRLNNKLNHVSCKCTEFYLSKHKGSRHQLQSHIVYSPAKTRR